MVDIDGVGTAVEDGSGVIVPSGARHNVRNTGGEPLKLYTLYGPPEHRDGIVQATKADAEARHPTRNSTARRPSERLRPPLPLRSPGEGQTCRVARHGLRALDDHAGRTGFRRAAAAAPRRPTSMPAG